MFKRLIALVVLSISMVGCATQEYSNLGTLTEKGKGYEATASFVQWNNDYAITAKHVTIVKKPDFVCSSGCDLVFFKHKADNFNSQQVWRDAVFGEPIKAVGSDVNRFVVEREGQVLKESVTDNPDSDYFYLANNAKTVGGMSGGAVYATKDNALIGMTIGTSKEALDAGIDESVFVPYEVIKKEWEAFQKSQHNG